MQLRCLGVTGREPQKMENGEHPAVNVNNISQNEQVNIAGVNNITMSQPVSKIKNETNQKLDALILTIFLSVLNDVLFMK